MIEFLSGFSYGDIFAGLFSLSVIFVVLFYGARALFLCWLFGIDAGAGETAPARERGPWDAIIELEPDAPNMPVWQIYHEFRVSPDPRARALAHWLSDEFPRDCGDPRYVFNFFDEDNPYAREARERLMRILDPRSGGGNE